MSDLPAERRSGHPGTAVGTGTRRCPRCGGVHLRPVVTAVSANLFCTGCHRCWRFEDGYLVEVNPYACSGCAERGVCQALGYGRVFLHWEESP